jgi:hypothetical protein
MSALGQGLTAWGLALLTCCFCVDAHAADGLSADDCGPVPEVTLCFDLRNDDRVLAALVDSVSPASTRQEVTYVLPFPSSEPVFDGAMLARWGSFDGVTLVTLSRDPNRPGQFSTSFLPKFASIEDPSFEISRLKENLYLMRNGLERRFIYRYPEASPGAFKSRWSEVASAVPASKHRYVGVILPDKATGTEIGATGRTAIPTHEHSLRKAKLFPGSTQHAGAEPALVVSYRLPVTDKQKVAYEGVLKTLIGVLGPILALVFMDSANVAVPQRRKRNRLLIVLIGVQLALFGVAAHLAYSNWTNDRLQALVDGGIAVLIAVLTAWVAWFKERAKPETADQTQAG